MKSVIIYFQILNLLVISNIYAQQKPQRMKYADFKNAIEIQDSIFGPTNVSLGYGGDNDFMLDPNLRENNSIWLKLKIYKDTVLTFDIVPIDSTDDYDFIIFKCIDNNCLTEIKSRKKSPDRICYSYNSSKSSTTGLSEYVQNSMVGIGDGPAYVSGIKVKSGETYYIMINNSYDGYHWMRNKFPKGFIIYFYNYWPKKKPFVLKNVQFENNKSILLIESYSELDKLVEKLKINSTMKIEIRGHTDNTGNKHANYMLSEKRAKAVADYIISKNINAKRVFYKGYGDSSPIANNDNEEGKKLNRRVEFAILFY